MKVNELGELEIIGGNQEIIVKHKLEKIEEEDRPTVIDTAIAVENEGDTEPFYQRVIKYVFTVEQI